MLGMGCPWKGTCQYKSDSFTRKNYCDSDSGCKKCPHRPMNDGNRKAQDDYNYAKGRHGDIKFGQILIVGVIIFAVIYFLFLK